jgi:hypothetical protein
MRIKVDRYLATFGVLQTKGLSSVFMKIFGIRKGNHMAVVDFMLVLKVVRDMRIIVIGTLAVTLGHSD